MHKIQEKRMLIGLTYVSPLLFAITILMIAFFAETTHNIVFFTSIFFLLVGINLVINHSIYLHHFKNNQSLNKTFVKLSLSQSIIVIGIIIFFVPFYV